MPRRNRTAVAFLTLALTVAACGESDEGGVDPVAQTPAAEASPASSEVPAVPDPTPSMASDAVSLSSAFAPYEDFGTDAEAGEFPRTVRHAMGETTLDEAPVRVVTLDTGELDAMIELGVKPLGVVDYGADGLPSYFDREDIEGIQVVGTIDAPNLEAIAALKPDLILSSKLRHEELYGQLSQIAPTIFAERPGVTWKQNFELNAQAVGREDEAAETKEKYQERVAELHDELPAERPAVSIVRVMADGNIRLYQRANFLGVLLTDLGFPRPAAQNVDDFATEVSLEQLGQADGDLIILSVFDATKNTHAAEVEGSAYWKTLEGVKAGDVHTVDDQTWLGGIGYHAAFEVMEQLAELTKA